MRAQKDKLEEGKRRNYLEEEDRTKVRARRRGRRRGRATGSGLTQLSREQAPRQAPMFAAARGAGRGARAEGCRLLSGSRSPGLAPPLPRPLPRPGPAPPHLAKPLAAFRLCWGLLGLTWGRCAGRDQKENGGTGDSSCRARRATGLTY